MSLTLHLDVPESLNELEDHDLDALVADLESVQSEQQCSSHKDTSNPTGNKNSPPAIYQESEPVVTFPVVTTQASRAVKLVGFKRGCAKLFIAFKPFQFFGTLQLCFFWGGGMCWVNLFIYFSSEYLKS